MLLGGINDKPGPTTVNNIKIPLITISFYNYDEPTNVTNLSAANIMAIPNWLFPKKGLEYFTF